MIKAHVLALPNFNKLLEVNCIALGLSIGGILAKIEGS